MKNTSLITGLLLLIIVISGISYFPANADHVIDDSSNTSYLYVASAPSGSLKGDILTLNGVPNIVYFSDRPARTAGHLSIEKFIASWSEANEPSNENPPNAVLSVLDNTSQNFVVEILSVESKNDSMSFKVKELQGEIPDSFEGASLFIDDAHIKTPGVF